MILNIKTYVICKKDVCADYFFEKLIIFKKGNCYKAIIDEEFFIKNNKKSTPKEVWINNRTPFKLDNEQGFLFFNNHFKTSLEPHVIIEKKM